MSEYWIVNGRLLDPASKTDRVVDVRIADGKIAEIAKPATRKGANNIDASGKWVIPGIVDIHVHLREPGQEYKEDIESGSKAAAAGGVTTMVAMPNTKPVLHNAELVKHVLRRGIEVGLARVLPSAAVTMDQKGERLTPFEELKTAGAVALTDDGNPVADPKLFRSALEYAKAFDLPVLTHAEELGLSCCGSMHEGAVSTELGLGGIPRVAEDVAVARDIMLAEYTGGWLHVCHVSTAGAVDLIRQAKARGVRVTGEGAPHHFALTHDAVRGYQTFAKMSPPLREEVDRVAVIEGLRDGTLDAIATDHAPHSSLEKDVAFDDAANGIIGLQTMLPLSLDLWRKEKMPLLDVIDRLTTGPARCLNLPYGQIKQGGVADIAIVDPNETWLFDASQILSKSHNSPFLGHTMTGRVVCTILEGKVVFTLTVS